MPEVSKGSEEGGQLATGPFVSLGCCLKALGKRSGDQVQGWHGSPWEADGCSSKAMDLSCRGILAPLSQTQRD